MEIIPDEFYPLTVNMPNGEKETYLLSPKYDRIDVFLELGHSAIKIYDDEIGLITLHTDCEDALRVHKNAGIPLVIRENITQTEYEGYERHWEATYGKKPPLDE